MNDDIIGAAVVCGAGAFTEEQLRAELEEGGVLNNCESAVATSTDFEACQDALNDDTAPPCDGTVIALPDTCVGAVFVTG